MLSGTFSRLHKALYSSERITSLTRHHYIYLRNVWQGCFCRGLNIWLWGCPLQDCLQRETFSDGSMIQHHVHRVPFYFCTFGSPLSPPLRPWGGRSSEKAVRGTSQEAADCNMDPPQACLRSPQSEGSPSWQEEPKNTLTTTVAWK